MVDIICIDDRKSKMLELNKRYKAIKDKDCYIINIDENNMKRKNSHYRKKNLKVKRKYFIEI